MGVNVDTRRNDTANKLYREAIALVKEQAAIHCVIVHCHLRLCLK